MIEKRIHSEKLLASGLKSTQQLFQLLNSEYEQLKQKTDPTALSTLAANKREVVAQLEQFSKQLGQVLATEKLLTSQEGVMSYLAKAKAADINIASSTSWLACEALVKCRALNSKMAPVSFTSRHTQRCCRLESKSQLTATYGPDGTTRSVLFSHPDFGVGLNCVKQFIRPECSINSSVFQSGEKKPN